MGNVMHRSCNLEVAKREALRLSRMVYSFKADSTVTVCCSVENNPCISYSDRDGSMHGGDLYEVMLAGRQLLNLDDFPTQSRAEISPK
jgi:hypothetical protein